ncbi:MAG: VPLPA-CTERM sorting domain-containing protein, partial [Pseudomonadota bacterium]|nr:VPLPA-CTERM sorting domain-containing protein [Pseudomonadota bacterium]
DEIDSYGTFNNENNLTNDGDFINEDGATLNNAGTFDNDFLLQNNSGGTISNSGNLTNTGTLNNTGNFNNYGVLNNSGSMSNSGIVYVTGGGSLDTTGGQLAGPSVLVSNGTLTLGTGSDVVISGLMTLETNGTVSVFGGELDVNKIILGDGTFNFTGGALNVDTFNGNLNSTGGTLSPGNSPGTTTVNGDYSQDATSTLLIEIEGLIAGTEHDVLLVGGTATLDGTLEFDVDYSGLTLGDSFNILEAEVIAGSFATITNEQINANWKWALDYKVDLSGTTDVLTATVTAVPIPAAVWLFGSALGLLGWMRRRQLH